MPVDKSAIGRTGEPVTMHVERGKIQEFALAIKDDDPLLDELRQPRRIPFLVQSRCISFQAFPRPHR